VPALLPAAGQPLDLSYRVHWQGTQMQRPPGAWVTQTRAGRGFQQLADDEQQFGVDFTGPSLDALPADAVVKAIVSAPANGEIQESNAYRLDATGQWRMVVRVRQIKTNEPTELRGFLQSGDNVLSETWSNVLPPLSIR
jgi:glucans biosynthesis protein